MAGPHVSLVGPACQIGGGPACKFGRHACQVGGGPACKFGGAWLSDRWWVPLVRLVGLACPWWVPSVIEYVVYLVYMVNSQCVSHMSLECDLVGLHGQQLMCPTWQ